MVADLNPPFQIIYKPLLDAAPQPLQPSEVHQAAAAEAEEVDLPLIDLARLTEEPEACKAEIRAAAAEWGFFQVMGHGVPWELLERLRQVQAGVFQRPFAEKEKVDRFFGFASDCYAWGTPSATSLRQLSWSESYHIPLSSPSPEPAKLRSRRIVDEYAMRVAQVAYELGGILAEGINNNSSNDHNGQILWKSCMEEHCRPSTCYLRLNRYPPCEIGELFGLVPHTDTDFLTILCQDSVGGLQLIKGGRWISVKPNSNALIVNIGDLFQAWSNDAYKSVEHRVMANPQRERYSAAFQLCPSYETVIHSPTYPTIYRPFTFMEYKMQIKQDVKQLGQKVGLSRFLVDPLRQHTNLKDKHEITA